MVLKIFNKNVKVRVIEWADRAKTTPVCFILRCPHCNIKQWGSINHVYIGYDWSKNNYRCKHCKFGLARKRSWDERCGVDICKEFLPKNVGWVKIDLFNNL